MKTILVQIRQLDPTKNPVNKDLEKDSEIQSICELASNHTGGKTHA